MTLDPSPGSILVIGAGGGIGAATVRCLADRGLSVVASAHRHPLADGVRAHIVPLDACDDASVAWAMAAFASAAGPAPLRGLVYAAGAADLGSVEHTPADVLARILDVNVVGAARVCRAFLPRLRADGGRIVLVGSLSGRLPQAHMAAYSAAKAALAAWADALRAEVAPLGVRVVLVEPGAVRTGLAASLQVRPSDRDPASPYREAVRARRTALLRDAARGLAPERVAGAIATALLDDDPPPRVVLDAAPWRTRLRLLVAAVGGAAAAVRGPGPAR